MALINDADMVDLVKEGIENLFGPDKVKILENPSLGLEDFAYFAAAAPGGFFRLGCKTIDGDAKSGHHPLFDIDEGCLPVGVALQVNNVLSFLSK